MYQGEAISVLSRAWQATNKPEFLDAANDCLGVFEIPVADGGILGKISALNLPWFEEYPAQSPNHVLNGMIFALWGLRDLVTACNSSRSKELFEVGVESVCKSIQLFDNGFWSWYWISEAEKPYISSMMYHGLHICQLNALAAQTSREDLRLAATQFSSYSRSLNCRFLAGATMMLQKCRFALGARRAFLAKLAEHAAMTMDS
jgi:hypothetical protein